MAELRNHRHERFAQEVANGLAGTTAYAAAGFAANPNSAKVNASRLLASPNVAERVAELRATRAQTARQATEKAAEAQGVTVASLIAEAEEARSAAMAAKQYAAAISAIKEKGVLSGMRVERRENLNRNLNDMSDDELADIARGGGDGAFTPAGRQALAH